MPPKAALLQRIPQGKDFGLRILKDWMNEIRIDD
jgi:hypothetical protein